MTTPRILSEKRLPHAIDLVAYCDLHDLVAIATDGHDVVIYRINGQVAFSIKRKESDLDITALAWKHDGSILAVGWSDGTYALHSGENGRILSQTSVRVDSRAAAWKLDLTADYDYENEGESSAVVTSFQFKRYSPSPPTLKGAPADLTTDAWAEDDMEDGKVPAKANVSVEKLTRSIATLDVTTILPRLSAIPPHGLRTGPDGNKFASQATTDLAFEVGKRASVEEVDSLLVCCDDGTVQVLMDDTVKIGTWKVPGKPTLQIASLETLGSPLLHVISTNTKRIQSLLAYITQTIRCSLHDYTNGLRFPARLMSGISSELKDKQEGDLITNLYHLSMTGQISHMMLEWLTAIVKETNHKRWHQSIDTMYANITNHLFINLKPALDRLSIATTELRGQARFHEGTTTFDVPPEQFTKILDGIDSLRIVSQKMLLIIMTEHKQFKAFSKWLRVMVEIGAVGPGSKEAWETEERENPNIDYPLVWDYIEQTLVKSRLARHIEPRTGLSGTCSKEDFFTKQEIAEMGYRRTLEAIPKLDLLAADETFTLDGVQDADALVNLPALAVYLSGNVRLALEQITEWQSKMLAPPESVPLHAEVDRVSLDGGLVSVDGRQLRTLDPKFVPKRLILGGRKGKQVCLALGDNQWIALDLDSKPAAPGPESMADDLLSNKDDAEMPL